MLFSDGLEKKLVNNQVAPRDFDLSKVVERPDGRATNSFDDDELN